MKRFAIAALALALSACGSSAPQPAAPLTPPSPSVIALAGRPPAGMTAAPAPSQAKTRVLDHARWSIEVPSDWTVKENTDEGATVAREVEGQKPALLTVMSQKLDADVEPEQYCVLMSVMAPAQVPDELKVVKVTRRMGQLNGHIASITQVNTEQGIFLGVVATVDEKSKTGYAIISIAPMEPNDGKLMATITKTFTIK